MTAEMNESNGFLDCRNIEFEGKNGVAAGDLSGDLAKIDCNGGDAIEEGKDDVVGSYVFVNGGTDDHVDAVVSDEVEKDPHLEDAGDPTAIVETEFVIEGESELGFDDSVGEEKAIESGDFGEEKKMSGVSCKENLEFEVVDTHVSEFSVLSHGDCANGSRIDLDGDGIEVKHVVMEENEPDARYIEHVDVDIGLESCEEVEVSQDSRTVENEAAESDLHPGEDQCIEQADVVVQLESAEEARPNQETQTIMNEVAELELPPIKNEDVGIQLESAKEESTNQETQMVANEAAEMELPPENGDAEIQLEPAEEGRTNQETWTVANEAAELELHPENGAAGIQVEPAKEARTNQETPMAVSEAAELELPPENGDVEIQLEPAKEERMNRETWTSVSEAADLKLRSVENGNAGIQLEPAKEERTNQETHRAVSEDAELELPPIENGDAGIHLESAEEDQEKQTVVNEAAELELPPIKNGESQFADQVDAGIQLQSEGEEMTQKLAAVVHGASELDLPPVENGRDTSMLNSPDEIQGEVSKKDIEPPMKLGVQYIDETVVANTCPVDDSNLVSESISNKDCLVEESGSTECSKGMSDCVTDAVSVEIEGDWSKTGTDVVDDDDRSTHEEVEGSKEIHKDGILLSTPEDHNVSTSAAQLGVEDVLACNTASDGQKVGETEVGNKDCLVEESGSTECSKDMSDCVTDAINVEIEGDGSKTGTDVVGDDDRLTHKEVEGSKEIHEDGILLSAPEDRDVSTSAAQLGVEHVLACTTASDGQKVGEIEVGNKDCLGEESGSTECSKGMSDCVTDAVNVEIEGDGSKAGTDVVGDDDRPTHEVVEGSKEIHEDVILLSAPEDHDVSTSAAQLGVEDVLACTTASDGQKVGEIEVGNKGCLVEESGSTECSKGMSDCVSDAVNVEIEGDGSKTGTDVVGDDDRSTHEEVEGSKEIQKDGILLSAPEDHDVSTSAAQLGVEDVLACTTASDGQKVGDIEVGNKHYLITIPRHIDNKIRSQIRLAQSEVDEKTRERDSLKASVQMKRATRDEYRENFEAAVADERAAKAAADTKRQEMGSVQLMINRMKDASSIDEIDDRIHGMEHMIAHETMPLKEEKQLIREIKQLKVAREQLYASIGKDTELQEVFEQRDKIEERFKLLKQEFEALRNDVFRAEGVTKAHKKKYSDALESFKESYNEWVAADKLRQEAYTKLQTLRKHAYERNNLFRHYKDDQDKAREYASAKDREALQCHCSKQVERIMELWNKNDEFRKEYIIDNMRSTLRRFKTLDGRSLGPDEEPAILTSLVEEVHVSPLNSGKKNTAVPSSAMEIVHRENDVAVAVETVSLMPTDENTAHKNILVKKSKKPTIAGTSIITTVSGGREDGEEGEKEKDNELTKEEEELAKLARKAEELRKEEAAAKLKEQRRLEEITKAKEAEERKKRNAEKANARAELRAQREAELKEKEREKRARKKAKRKAAAENSSIEEETTPTLHSIPPGITPEPETKEMAAPSTAVKRAGKSSTAVKQAKPKPLAMPPRHRDKRKMQTWVWILLLTVAIAVLVLVSNSFTINSGLPSFGF